MMNEHPALDAQAYLAALRLSDSGFPTGLYTQSHALEAYVAAGRITDAAGVKMLLEDVLREQLASADLVATAHAWRGARRGDPVGVRAADVALEAARLCREPREASRRSGARMLRLIADQTGDELLCELAADVRAGRTPGHNSPATGAVSAVLGLPLEATLLAEINAFATSFLSAAMRLLAFDHIRTQAVLAELAPLMAELAADAGARDLAAMANLSPLADIMAMHHERDQVRLFAS